MAYRYMKVEYMLDERQIEALEELLEHWQKIENKAGERPFANWKIENIFQSVMETGCTHVISQQIKNDQFRHGLIGDKELIDGNPFRTPSERKNLY